MAEDNGVVLKSGTVKAKPGDNLRKAGNDARDSITEAVKSIAKNLKPRKAAKTAD